MLHAEEVTVRFGDRVALAGVMLEVARGEVVAVLGASGSGKSTLLRVIAGLQAPGSGRVLLEGEDLAPVPAHRRGIGLVFQDHVLFHHMDVADNVAFGLRMRGDARREIDRQVRELLDLVGLHGFGSRSVATLSGGEQQRVALARALAPEPRVLLLDEPLGSLDRPLRERLLEDLDVLFAELRVTALFVTHDQAEAFALGDRVAIMREGRVVQVGTPDELWAHPADTEVARFLGLGNVRDGTVVRPEAITVRHVETGGAGDGVVESLVRHGPTVHLTIRLDDGSQLDAAVTSLEHPAPGERVSVEIDPAGMIAVPDNASAWPELPSSRQQNS